MQVEEIDRLIGTYRANWHLNQDVEAEFRALWRGVHADQARAVMDKILADRRDANKFGKYDGPSPNEFHAVAYKLHPKSSKDAPPSCEVCSHTGWRSIILCGPNSLAHPCQLVVPEQMKPDAPLAKHYWTHRVPCRCEGGEYRRQTYTKFDERDADRMYSASLSVCRAQWFAEDLQAYADHVHNGTPLRNKGEPDPWIAKAAERLASTLSGKTAAILSEKREVETAPVEESWEKAEERW